MLKLLNPTYTMKVVVTDKQGENKVGKAQFWNALIDKTGCDEAVKAVKKALEDYGISAEVFFERFEHV